MTSNQEVYRQRLSESWLSHKGCSTEQDDADAHVQLGIRLSLAASRLRFFFKACSKTRVSNITVEWVASWHIWMHARNAVLTQSDKCSIGLNKMRANHYAEVLTA